MLRKIRLYRLQYDSDARNPFRVKLHPALSKKHSCPPMYPPMYPLMYPPMSSDVYPLIL